MNRAILIFLGSTLLANFHVKAKLASNSDFYPEQQEVFTSRNKLKITSAQQAASIVMSRYGGKVLKVSKQKVNGGSGYKVKLLKDNGQIISVVVDATSGRLKGN